MGESCVSSDAAGKWHNVYRSSPNENAVFFAGFDGGQAGLAGRRHFTPILRFSLRTGHADWSNHGDRGFGWLLSRKGLLEHCR